jgi:hypothetical protein
MSANRNPLNLPLWQRIVFGLLLLVVAFASDGWAGVIVTAVAYVVTREVIRIAKERRANKAL